jgi:hypothetical protein
MPRAPLPRPSDGRRANYSGVRIRGSSPADLAKIRRWEDFRARTLRKSSGLVPGDFLGFARYLADSGVKSTLLYVNAAFLWESEHGFRLSKDTVCWGTQMAAVYSRVRAEAPGGAPSKAKPFTHARIDSVPLKWRGLFSFALGAGLRMFAVEQCHWGPSLRLNGRTGGRALRVDGDKGYKNSDYREIFTLCCCRYGSRGESWCHVHKLSAPRLPIDRTTIAKAIADIDSTASRHSFRRSHILGIAHLAQRDDTSLKTLLQKKAFRERLNSRLGWQPRSRTALKYACSKNVHHTPVTPPPIQAAYDYYVTGTWNA